MKNWEKTVYSSDKNEFAKAALNRNSETFLVYFATLEVSTTMLIQFFRASQVHDNPILTVL